ncbi:fatty-acid-CoA ligase [Nannizzia gypsea CBS 118893]|uniref:Fatty-acid-CoA ligase n=1 Tax=Arthroderma gypseum (strain ATCC MYA-4604 / CBS 118893) TaxID=535722 RepID=E4V4A3_ARTGP|nr:fatty-acid-CoA ligase [Nannizzia gypsea CBS 118893]EFR04827.1 fatty-acid-CoA ligase [Nannizzia gypsea CBS 118893]
MDDLLALVEGGPALKPTINSLWTALHQRASIQPDRLALLSPRQPGNLLEGLVRPRGRRDESGSRDALMRSLKRAATPAYMLSYLLSWVLPAPDTETDYLRWSFAELQRATIRLASFLRRRGVKPGATGAFFTPVCAEWALMLSVSAYSRYTGVTLDRKTLAPGNEHDLRVHMNTLSPSFIIVTTVEEALHLAGQTDVALGICLENFATPAPEGWLSMADIAASSYEEEEEEEVEEAEEVEEKRESDRTAFVVFTSGSSGIPKGCPVSASQILSLLGAVSKQMPLLPTPMTLVSGTCFRSLCTAITLMSWASGNAAVMDASNEATAETKLAGLQTCRPAFASVTVTALSSIARSPNYTADAIRSVRFVHLIGSTMTASVLRRAKKTFPHATILPSFGMSEAAKTVTWEAAGGVPSVDKIPTWHGIAASGKVAPGERLKVVDIDGNVARRNHVGALHLSGDSVIGGYLGGANSAAFYVGDDGHHWFVSGDDAVIDDQGLLYVLGRSEYTLRRDSKLILPCIVENFLETQFEGSSAAVVNITTSNGDRGLFAVLEHAVPAPASAAVQELVAQKLGLEYRVEGAVSLNELGFEKWPLTSGEKVAYRDLRLAIEEFLTSKTANL